MKMLINFTVSGGRKHSAPNEVLFVVPRGKKYVSASGDIFRARFARVAEKKKYGVDLVAVG